MLDRLRHEFIDKNLQFVLTDNKGTILEKNDSFLSSMPGESIFNIHPFFEVLESLQHTKDHETTFNCIYLKVDGVEYITDITAIGQEVGWLIVIKDLTEHYNNYQTAAQTRNESIINAELIVLKNIELQERERFKNQFIQNFSHELRNPLTNSISITHLLGETGMTNEQKGMLDYLRQSHLHLKLMLEDTLSIGMIASGKMALREKDFNLPRLLELLEFTYRAKAKLKGLEFGCTIDEKVPEFVHGDRLRLYQVLANLLENALKYTETGSVSFHVGLNQKWANIASIHFSVSDTGTGIAAENLPEIFDSFSQFNTHGKQAGVGLGLAVVKGLLEIMGSEIKVTSVISKGTEFYFDLNLKFSMNLISSQGLKEKKKEWDTSKNGRAARKFNLLIVEDDEHLQAILFKILLGNGHFHIDLVNDGAKVIEQLIDNPCDLILMDINLPNSNGDQVTRLIRDFPFKNIKNIPIIGLTANAYKENIDDYLKAGMNALLTKPFEQETLLETIFKFLK